MTRRASTVRFASRTVRAEALAILVLAFVACGRLRAGDSPATGLRLSWEKNYLTISGDAIPGGPIRTLYLEAYCRPNCQEADWGRTPSSDTRRSSSRRAKMGGVSSSAAISATVSSSIT